MATNKAKSNWLANSYATHGDGSTGKAAGIKGAQSASPIKTHGDGTQKASPKGKGQDSKTPATFGSKSGGGMPNNGPMKTTYTKGLMQKGK